MKRIHYEVLPLTPQEQEKIGIEQVIKYSEKYNGLYHRRLGIEHISEARHCSTEEATLFLAQELEKRGHLEMAAKEYTEIRKYDQTARIYEGLGWLNRAGVYFLDAGNVKEARRLAKKSGNNKLLARAWERENKWVAKAIYERDAKRNAKTVLDRVKAHASSSYVNNEHFLEICLTKKLGKETRKAVKSVLDRLYASQIDRLESNFDPRDGGPSIAPEDWALHLASEYKEKRKKLHYSEHDAMKQPARETRGGRKE